MEQYRDTIFDRIHPTWRSLLDTKDLVNVIDELAVQDAIPTLCPQIGEIFNAFKYTPPSLFHSIIVGQDPYSSVYMDETTYMERPTAHGLAFSTCAVGVPPSLVNIFKCLKASKLIDDDDDPSPNLIMWAQQGVLLLNTALTTVIGKTNAHLTIWQHYIKSLIARILDAATAKNKRINIMLWGSKAIHILNERHRISHNVLTWSHPSPLSDNRLPPHQKFVVCDHFTKVSNICHKMCWDPNISQHIFTDGSYRRKSQVGGYAVICFYGGLDGYAIYGTTPPPATNQVSEGTALLKAIECANAHNIYKPIIVTDSQFYINVITKWMSAWYANDPTLTKKLDGEKIANVELIRKIYAEWQKLCKFTTPSIMHQRSHQPPPPVDSPTYHLWYGNSLADKYANESHRCGLTCEVRKFIY